MTRRTLWLFIICFPQQPRLIVHLARLTLERAGIRLLGKLLAPIMFGVARLLDARGPNDPIITLVKPVLLPLGIWVMTRPDEIRAELDQIIATEPWR
jgi:hypothetical protein